MPAEREEGLPLKLAAKMLGMSDRAASKLLRQGKLLEHEAGAAARAKGRGRGRPALYVTRGSVEEYARASYRVLREAGAEEQRGQHASLSRWLNANTRLMGRIRRARIAGIDGQGAGGQVWVRFRPSAAWKREVLACFWRQDAAGGLFGARKFRVELDDGRAAVFVRSTDEESDRFELARCVSLAEACVIREEARLEKTREAES